jgi:hypothetical protein
MPLVDPLPSVHHKFVEGRVDENAAFSSAKTTTFTDTTVTIASVAYPIANADSLATAFEKCILLIDLTDPNHPMGFAFVGGFVLITKNASNEATGLKVSQISPPSEVTYTIGEGWSTAAHLRAAGFGTAFVPPGP